MLLQSIMPNGTSCLLIDITFRFICCSSSIISKSALEVSLCVLCRRRPPGMCFVTEVSVDLRIVSRGEGPVGLFRSAFILGEGPVGLFRPALMLGDMSRWPFAEKSGLFMQLQPPGLKGLSIRHSAGVDRAICHTAVLGTLLRSVPICINSIGPKTCTFLPIKMIFGAVLHPKQPPHTKLKYIYVVLRPIHPLPAADESVPFQNTVPPCCCSV